MPKREHILPPPELELAHTLHDDRHRLEEVDVPIVTVSASFKGEIGKHLGEKPQTPEEIVFSRAHYSMAVAVFSTASSLGLSAWLVDPVNYVSPKDWQKMIFMERVGRLAARFSFIKRLKNFVDSLVRTKLPLAGVIKKPLIYLTERTVAPVISLHYETGNILAVSGKKVVQVVTDPHVRPQYLLEGQRENLVYAVFDQETKNELLRKAQEMGKKIQKQRVFVTGPPVDVRIVGARKNKNPQELDKRGLRLLITTGGLGTNKNEIRDILEDLLPILGKEKIELILYAGTHLDFREMFYSLSKKFKVDAGDIDTKAQVRVIYDESIIRANQELVEHAFPWADGVMTKPSGDMAYDGAASGSFLFFLEPWGEWEENIRKIFIKMDIGQEVRGDFAGQLKEALSSGWAKGAMKKSLSIDPLFLNGARNIVKLQQSMLPGAQS